MSGYKKLLAASLCFFTIEELHKVSAYGPYPYQESPYYPPFPSPYASYPPPSYPPPSYPPPSYPPPSYPPSPCAYYPPSCYAPPPPPQLNFGYRKPKYVKPLHLSPSSPMILPGQGFSNTPIIISSKPRPSQPPSLLSPLTNLINSFLRSFVPRSSCDCEYDY